MTKQKDAVSHNESAANCDEGQEEIWLERFRAKIEEASVHHRNFLEWLDKLVPDTEEKLRLPYSSPPDDELERGWSHATERRCDR